MAHGTRRGTRTAALLGSAAMWTMATAAAAQDATWSATPENVVFGGRSDYQDPANWVEGQVPQGTATFAATSESDIFFDNQVGQQPLTIGRFVFTSAAPAYTFTLQSDEFTFTGDGIVNNSSSTQTLIAGNRSILRFANSSSAGNAALTAMGGTGRIFFEDDSHAGTAAITVGMADSAGRLDFFGSSSAANATINNPLGSIFFTENSTAGNATITNDSGLFFRDAASLGTATITNNGGIAIFRGASGPNARIINNMGATVDVSSNDGTSATSIGSLSGAGKLLLGSVTLSLGNLGLNDSISGAISDGGDLGGSGGGLTKVGAGTLTLTGASAYGGATTVNGGTLLLTGSITGAGATIVGSGSGADGRLTIQGGGTFGSAGNALIGEGGGSGIVNVTGAGSAWTHDGGLSVGSFAGGGVGRLNVQAGGTVTSSASTILNRTQLPATDGRVLVTGPNSVWNSGNLLVQSPGSVDALTISAGGRVNSAQVNLAGAALATGPGSVWTTGHLVVGPNLSANGNPAGRLTIANGAVVTSASAVLGEGGSFTSSVTIDGAGSAWNSGTNLVISPTSFISGQVSVLNGGTLNVANGTGTIAVGPNGGASFLNVGGGAPGTIPGTVNAASVQLGADAFLTFDFAGSSHVFAPAIAGTGQVVVGGGTTILTGNSSAFAGTTTIEPGTLQIGNGGAGGALGGHIVNNGALIINRGSSTFALDGLISGTGSLTQNGTPTTTVSQVNSYTGATTVNGGTLLVNGSIAASSGVTVNDGATLAGTGTVGATSIADGGTLAPGASIGRLTVDGSLSLATGASLLFEIGPGSADLLDVTGAASLGGTLTAIATGGAYTPGQFTLLSAGGGLNGTFSAVTMQGSFGDLQARLRYDASNVYLVLGRASSTFTTTSSQSDAIQFNAPTIVVERVGLFETRLIGRLAGGEPLFDQTYDAAFDSPTVQNGLQAARLAITAAGGPGVIVLVTDPLLVSREVTSSATSTSRFTLAETRQSLTTTTTFGPATISTGDRRSCGDAVAALPSGVRPACDPAEGDAFPVAPGSTNVNTDTRTDYVVDETRTDTVTETTRETYELTGTVVPVGTVHAAVQSGLFELGGRFLRRIGEEGAPYRFGEPRASGSVSALAPGAGHHGWAEGYGFRSRGDARGGVPAERRDAWGLAGGFGIEATAGLQLGFGVDHGELDLAVAATAEQADVELTQIGAGARFGSGRFGLAVAASYGFGSVDSRRDFMGTSAGAYDVSLWGAFAEAWYLFEAGEWRIVPVLALDHVRIESDAFAETRPLGLAAPETGRRRTGASAGLQVGRGFGRIDLAASARFDAVLSGTKRTLPVTFNAAPGTPLVMRGLAERDAAAVEAQATLRISPAASLYLVYDGRFTDGYDAHGAAAGVRVVW